jgi:hypothetical protein
MPRVFDQALREALEADHVLMSPAGGAPPGPDGRALLSIPTDTAFGRWATVHIRRRGRPFDERDERVARQIVGLMGTVLSACSTTGDRATMFIEDTLNRLDLMGSHTVVERLALVARNACQWFDAAGWSIGVLDDGFLVTLDDELPEPRPGPVPGDVLQARTAVTAQYVRDALEGGSFVVTADADDALGDLVRRHGTGALVAAGGYDVDALQWMVSVLDGGNGHDLLVARSALSAAVQAALGFPRPPRSSDHLRLVGGLSWPPAPRA